MTFNKWLDTFIAEKGIDVEQILQVEGPSGANFIPVGCVVEAMKLAQVSEQSALQQMIVKLDFYNADIVKYFKHLAQAIAK